MSTSQLTADELAEKLIAASRKYYDEDNPEMTDSEWDALFAKLKALDPLHPALRYLGSPVSRAKVPHVSVMGSLTKVTTHEGVLAAFKDVAKVIITPKLDGMALELRYENGRLVQAVTRGDGLVGEDVTSSAALLEGVPAVLKDASLRRVRGEAAVFEEALVRLAESGEEVTNGRNMVAGAIRNSDTEKLRRLGPVFIAYDVPDETAGTYYDTLRKLRENEFYTVPEWVVRLPAPLHYAGIRQYLAKAIRANFCNDIATDGLVLRISDNATCAALGYNGKLPQYAVAYKFPPAVVKTELTSYSFTTSRTGRVVPVYHFEPVQVAGTTVCKATGNNAKWVLNKAAVPGDTLLVCKANEIIPEVCGVEHRGEARFAASDLPTTCSACGGPLQFSVEDTDLMCNNATCPAKGAGKWLHVLRLLGIKGIGVSSIETLVQHFGSSLFSALPESIEALGFGPQQAVNIHKALHSVKEAPGPVLLACMGIPGWGRTMFKSLSVELQKKILYDNIDKEELARLEEIPGVGPEKAATLRAGLQSDSMRRLLLQQITPQWPVEGQLTGVTLCITGTLTVSRQEMAKWTEGHGAIVKDSVTKALTVLVAGENAGSKIEKAKKLGIPVLTEAEIRAMVGGA